MSALVVVDTNVPVTANGDSGAPPDCVLTCVGLVSEIVSNQRPVAIDTEWQILGEYMSNLRSSGQPGVGDQFLRWVLTNQENPSRCVKVPITVRNAGLQEFEEFPTTTDLSSFDPSDRKFVAVSCAHSARPSIWQATDSKWWGWKEALNRAGVTVEFLCPDYVKRKYDQKFPAGRRPKKDVRDA